jgi:hypothetical protein
MAKSTRDVLEKVKIVLPVAVSQLLRMILNLGAVNIPW